MGGSTAILAFDHRSTFRRLVANTPTPRVGTQFQLIAECKRLVFDAYDYAIRGSLVSAQNTSIIVDEECAAPLALRAEEAGYTFGMPVERTEMDVFEFEYGDDWKKHIGRFRANYYKGLVRWNPEDSSLNRQQIGQLRELSRFLRDAGRGFLLELLVPPSRRELSAKEFDAAAFDVDIRPAATVTAIEELHAEDVAPDIWKIEGVSRRSECERIGAAARSHADKPDAGCVVLGRSAPDDQVRRWLAVSAGVPGYHGFAIGRSVFNAPLAAWLRGEVDDDAVIEAVAVGFADLVDFYDNVRLDAGRSR